MTFGHAAPPHFAIEQVEFLRARFLHPRSAFMSGESNLSDWNTRNVSAEVEHTAATDASNSRDEAPALSPPHSIERARDNDANTSDLLSPKTLFPDSNHSLLSSVRLPGEQSLTDLVAHSLKLPPAVALQVARCMKATVEQNLASSADFRANFFPTRGPQFEGSGSAHARRPGSAVSRSLALAEQALQVDAVRSAEEEEEKFHARVVAAQGHRRMC